MPKRRHGRRSFGAKLKAHRKSKRKHRARARDRKPGSRAKLAKYSTSSTLKSWSLPIGIKPKNDIIRMRRVFRVDTTNVKPGEQTDPLLLFNMNDPSCPTAAWGGFDEFQAGLGTHQAHLKMKHRFPAMGYGDAAMNYKKGIVLRSKITCEWVREPIMHVHRDDNTSGGMINTVAEWFKSSQEITAPKVMGTAVTYEKVPAAYVITQVGKNNMMWTTGEDSRPLNAFNTTNRSPADAQPPFWQQPSNPAMDSVTALLSEEVRRRDTQMKYKRISSTPVTRRYKTTYLYDRSKHFKESASQKLRELDPVLMVGPSGTTMQDKAAEDNDAFFFQTAQLNVIAPPGVKDQDGVQVKKYAAGQEHPNATISWRWQAIPEDTAVPLYDHNKAQITIDRNGDGFTEIATPYGAPLRKALGKGYINVVIDYIVLCSDPFTTDERRVVMDKYHEVFTQTSSQWHAEQVADAADMVVDQPHRARVKRQNNGNPKDGAVANVDPESSQDL